MPLDARISPIRLLTEQDIPWALDLAEKCLMRKLDKNMWTEHVRAALKNPSVYMVRGEESAVVCDLYREVPGHPEINGRFLYWFHRGDNPRELVRCFETCIDWLGHSGAHNIWLCPTAGGDFTVLARTLGFEGQSPAFVMKVGHA